LSKSAAGKPSNGLASVDLLAVGPVERSREKISTLGLILAKQLCERRT
jgi:hypothetical protein